MLAICAEILASETEDGVFTLEGVRQYLAAESFPCEFQPCLFLVLSSARAGTYQGKVLLIQERSDRTIRYVKFEISFREANERLSLGIDLGTCLFPEPGLYTFQVWFTAPDGEDALKAEQLFDVLAREE